MTKHAPQQRRIDWPFAVAAIIALVVGIGVVMVVNDYYHAAQASGHQGTNSMDAPLYVKSYMDDNNRPKTPQDATRVGVVTETQTKMKPWPRASDSLWHATVYTKADGELLKLGVWVSKNPLEVSQRVHVGDYVALFGESNPPGGTSYTDRGNFKSIRTLVNTAVPNIPNDEY